MAGNPAFQQASQRTQLDVFLGKAENHLAGAAWATIGRMRLAAEDVDGLPFKSCSMRLWHQWPRHRFGTSSNTDWIPGSQHA